MKLETGPSLPMLMLDRDSKDTHKGPERIMVTCWHF
jgi:hypothetical protein